MRRAHRRWHRREPQRPAPDRRPEARAREVALEGRRQGRLERRGGAQPGRTRLVHVPALEQQVADRDPGASRGRGHGPTACHREERSPVAGETREARLLEGSLARVAVTVAIELEGRRGEAAQEGEGPALDADEGVALDLPSGDRHGREAEDGPAVFLQESLELGQGLAGAPAREVVEHLLGGRPRDLRVVHVEGTIADDLVLAPRLERVR